MTSINTTTKDLPTWHLNLDRSLADVRRDEEWRKERKARWSNDKRIRRKRELQADAKISFAGKEGVW